MGFGDIPTVDFGPMVDFWCSNFFFSKLHRVSSLPPQMATHYVRSLRRWHEHQGPRPTLGHSFGICKFSLLLSESLSSHRPCRSPPSHFAWEHDVVVIPSPSPSLLLLLWPSLPLCPSGQLSHLRRPSHLWCPSRLRRPSCLRCPSRSHSESLPPFVLGPSTAVVPFSSDPYYNSSTG